MDFFRYLELYNELLLPGTSGAIVIVTAAMRKQNFNFA